MATRAFVNRSVTVTAIEADPIETFDLFPQGAGAITYVNRVWDSMAAGFVRWRTDGAADALGVSYPGPGTFGVHTSDYCVEGVL